MNTLNVEDLVQVSGGLIGGGSTPSGIPLLDASSTREPGQNSYGETVPGGFEHYYGALSMADAYYNAQRALTAQIGACATGAGLNCLFSTINAIRAIDATTVASPYTKGPQGK